jgi:hypothetical protein
MGCKICDDLNRLHEEAVSSQREAQDAFARATNRDERETALVALAKARRESLNLRQRLEVHKEKCLAKA